MSDEAMCWFCKREPATEENGWCAACTRALDGVVLVPNNITDAALVASLREQVRALTAERDDAIRRAQEWQQAAEDLRAHAVELERALLIEREDARPLRGEVIILKMERDSLRARVAELEKEREEDQGVIRVWRGRTERAESERDAAQQRAKALEVCLARELTKEEAP